MSKILIRDREMFYEEKGAGFPLVFSHSFLWDHQMWAPQIDALSKKYRCINIDLWGHGLSDSRPEKEISLEQIAEDTWTLIEALDLERFAFVGLSVGGMIGAILALSHPEKIQSLSVMGSYVGAEPSDTLAEYLALMSQISETGYFSQELQEMLAPYFFSPKTYHSNPKLIENFKESLAAITAEKIETITSIGKGIFTRSCLLKKLESMKVPTQYIVGSDDGPRPPKESEEMASLTPGAECHVIPDAGHISCLEKPDFVTKAIDAFVQKASNHSCLKSVA